jgi:hypothetical protein
MSQNDPHSLLQRILGEEADPLIQMLRQQSDDEALLKSHGIDTDAMLKRAKAQISHAEKLIEHGINPPIPIEDLTEAQFEALDIPTLEKYLAAGDVDLQRLLTRTKQLLEDAKPKPAPGFFASISARLPRWQGIPVAGFAVSAIALVAVGVGVLTLTPRTPQDSLVQLQEPALSVTLAENPQQQSVEKTLKASDTPSMLTPESKSAAIPEVTGTLAARQTSTLSDSALSGIGEKDETNETEIAEAMPTASSVVSAPVQAQDETGQQNSESTPAPQNLIAEIAPTTETIPESQWALTAAPVEPAGQQTIEFIFEPGDTLSHGMARSGLPASLSMALAEKVGTDFWPGDKLIIYFENDEFEQLVVIRRKKEQTTVTADLKTSTAPAGMSNMIEVTGEITSSLYVALEKKLDANAAQRISWLLQSRKVPLNMLPKGATFTVQIEQITNADGETLGYGEIKSVQLDAGSQGQFEV